MRLLNVSTQSGFHIETLFTFHSLSLSLFLFLRLSAQNQAFVSYTEDQSQWAGGKIIL